MRTGKYKATKKSRKIVVILSSFFLIGVGMLVAFLVDEHKNVKAQEEKIKTETLKDFNSHLRNFSLLDQTLRKEYSDIQITVPNEKLKDSYPKGTAVTIDKNLSFNTEPYYGINYKIVTGTHPSGSDIDVEISVYVYKKHIDYLKENSFPEAEGKIKSVSILSNIDDYPVNGVFMKKLIGTISKGLDNEFGSKKLEAMTNQYYEDTKEFYNVNLTSSDKTNNGKAGSYYENGDIGYTYSTYSPGKQTWESLGWKVYNVNITLIEDELYKKTYHVLYGNNEDR